MSVDTVPTTRIRTILGSLIRDRQSMRTRGAEASLLEANRLGIVYWQTQLSQAITAEQRKRLGAA